MPEFEIQERTAMPALAVHLHSRVDRIPAELAVALPEAWHAAEQLGLPPSGPPFARYQNVPSGEVDYEAGVPIPSVAPSGLGRAMPAELPGGTVAVGWHVGPYETLDQTYDAVMRWVADQGRVPCGPMWEVYWTNPDESADPSSVRTEVIVPVR